MLDGIYPGLSDLLADWPRLTTRDLLANGDAVELALATMGAMCGVPYTIGEEAWIHYNDLSTADGRFMAITELAWIARWRACKQVYRIDPAVASEIMATPIDGDIPIEALRRMPYPIVYVEHPCEFAKPELVDGEFASGTEKASGFLAYLDIDAKSTEQLCICYLARGGVRVPILLDIEGCSTLEQMVDDAMALDVESERSILRFDDSDEQRECFKRCTAEALSLLLYVISEENDPEIVYAPPKRQAGRKPPKNPNPETVTLLGARMGRKIGQARKAGGARGGAAPSSRSVAPHMRRAHWAHYWTGKRKGRDDGKFGDELVLKWISPIAVGGAGDADEVVHRS